MAEIRDKALRQAYVTRLGGWLGITDREAWHSVRAAEKWHQQSSRHNTDFRAQRARSDSSAIPSTGIQVQLDPLIDTDPVLRLERDVLIAALRFPDLAAQTHFDSLTPDSFTQPTLRAVFEAILSSGGTKKYLELRDAAVQAGGNTPDKVALNRWAGGVKHEAGSILSAALTGLATRPVPVRQAEEAPSWVHSVVDSLERMSLNRRIGDLRARLNRLSSSDESREQVFSELIELENEKRQLDPEY